MAERALPAFRGWINPFSHTLRFYYPLTAAGTVVFVVFVYLLGSAFGSHNAYAFVFSVLGFFFLMAASVVARVQAFRLGRLQLSWDSSSALYARVGDVTQRLHTGEFRPLHFFRLHFLVTGRLSAGNGADFHVRVEGASSGGSEIELPMSFPLCGALDVNGRLLVRDVFGLVRAQVTDPENRRLTVRPPLFPDKPPVRFQTLFSNEAARKMTSADEEKYYMREYIAGDRIKDINWKASIRISELITRISPMSPEESRIVHLELRNFSRFPKDNADTLVQLNYIKSWMLSFMTAVKRDHAEFQFRVLTGENAVLVRGEEDFDQLAARLSVLKYIPESGAFHDADRTAREKFIFTTEFDDALQAHLGVMQGVRCHVFRTKRTRTAGRKPRVVHLGFDPQVTPGLWILRPAGTGVSHEASPAVSGSLTEEVITVSRL